MKRKSILLSTLLIATLLCCLTSGVLAQSGVNKLTLKEKKFQRLLKKENTILLDVRTAEEYQSGHLPNSINIDVKQPDFLRQVQTFDTTKTYLLYCRSGRRSQTALTMMKAHGFKKVYHLKGGIDTWKGRKE
jgi:thioredoxin 1